MFGTEFNQKADETILELYRLSGVLLLIPGDTSYLEKAGSDELSKAILQMEEILNAFTGPRARDKKTELAPSVFGKALLR